MALSTLYLSVAPISPDGRILAVCSFGSPVWGDEEVIVCAIADFDPPLDAAMPLATEWFAQMQVERPWETRQ